MHRKQPSCAHDVDFITRDGIVEDVGTKRERVHVCADMPRIRSDKSILLYNM